MPTLRLVESIPMTLIVNQSLPYSMADNQADDPEHGEGSSNAEAVSFRSRASSVISTGTKFSISTMPQGHFNIDDVLGGYGARTTSTRPASMYTLRACPRMRTPLCHSSNTSSALELYYNSYYFLVS